MLPHERSLVARWKDAPFALLGINSDRDLDATRKRCEAEKISWRNFYEGDASAPPGAISKAWHVRGWPTLFLVDATGTIRRKWMGSPDEEALDREIDALVAETKRGPHAPGTEPGAR
jgi:hypothetical protein